MSMKRTGIAWTALLFLSSASVAPVSWAVPVAADNEISAMTIESVPVTKRNQAAERQMQAAPGSKIDLVPLPVTIYLMDRQKPMVAFTTPCILIERLTNGFPLVLAFENFMFEVIGNVNESDLLPFKIEPVCI